MQIKTLVLFFCLSTSLAAPPHAEQPHDLFSHFWNISEVLYKLQTKSFRKLDMSHIIEEGLKAMLSKVDAHSSFFTPKSYQSTIDSASGQFAGIGISLISKAVDDDSLMIVEVIRGGPAEAAGLESGDKIVQIDSARLRGLTSDEVVNALKGPIGSTVHLKVIRDKKPLSFTLERKVIKDKMVSGYQFPEQNVTYIAIKSFDEQTPHLVRSFLEKTANTSRGIILDLRKNTGGVFEAAVDTASLFLPNKSLVVTTRNNKKQVVRSYHTNGDPIHKKTVPLFILVDNFTASAAEILAGTLQHHAQINDSIHAFIVGTSTFGKGSVQEVTPLSNGYALKLTTLLYYLPNNTCLQAHGIMPDITCKPKKVSVVEMKWVEEMYGKESSLKGHITRAEVEGKKAEEKDDDKPCEDEKSNEKTLTQKKLSPEKLEQARQKTLTHDHQIQMSLSLARIYCLAQTSCPKRVKSAQDAVNYLRETLLCDVAPKIELL